MNNLVVPASINLLLKWFAKQSYLKSIVIGIATNWCVLLDYCLPTVLFFELQSNVIFVVIRVELIPCQCFLLKDLISIDASQTAIHIIHFPSELIAWSMHVMFLSGKCPNRKLQLISFCYFKGVFGTYFMTQNLQQSFVCAFFSHGMNITWNLSI